MTLLIIQWNITREEGKQKESNSYSIKFNKMLLQLSEAMILMGNQWNINREEGINRNPMHIHLDVM